MRSIALALMLACAGSSHLCAQTASDFMGTYDLVRFESPDDSGGWVTFTDSYGPDPLGIIMCDGVGTMSVQIATRDRESEDRPNRYMAYYGRYEVDTVRRVVTHLRENHTNPAQATEEAVRGFEFDGDLLILTVEPAQQRRVIWRKRR